MCKDIKSSYPIIILMVLTVAVSANTVFNGFVWDDNLYLLNNPVYKNFDFTRMFTSLGNGLEYLPVRDMTYAIDYAIWGNNPSGFHLGNMLYYCLNVIAVYFLACLLAAAPVNEKARRANRKIVATGFTTALLFAVHPLHSEVVSFLTCRNALLSTLFFLLSCILYLHFMASDAPARRVTFYSGALACFTLSLFSKANGIILPLILLYLTFFVAKRRTGRDLVPIIPFIALSGAVFMLFTRIAAAAHIINYSNVISGHANLHFLSAKILHILFFYAQKFMIPFDYSAEYDFTLKSSLSSPVNAVTILFLSAAIIVAIRYRRTRPYLLTGIAWYLITLIPVLNIFPTTPIVADRYAFLPSFAFVFLIASAGVDLVANNPRLRITGWVGVAMLAGWWSVLTIYQNKVWKSEETLWEHTIVVSPNNSKARANLGRVLFGNGKFAQAFLQFDRARQINFNDPHYDFFEGIVLLGRQDKARALESFMRALQRDPQFIEGLLQVGMLLEDRGEYRDAANFFKFALNSPEPDNGNFRATAIKHLDIMRMRTDHQ